MAGATRYRKSHFRAAGDTIKFPPTSMHSRNRCTKGEVGPFASLYPYLAAHYRLEDLSDSGPNGLGLTNVNSATFAPAKIDNGASLATASSQRLTRANTPLLNLGGRPWWISFWARLASNGVYGAVAMWDTSHPMWHITARTDLNRWTIRSYNGSGFANSNVSGVSSSVWYWVQAWGSGDDIYLSIDNGAPASSTLAGGVDPDWEGSLSIGHSEDGFSYFDGLIDELIIVKGTLPSAAQRALLASGEGFA